MGPDVIKRLGLSLSEILKSFGEKTGLFTICTMVT